MLPVYGDSYRPSSNWSKKLEAKKKEWTSHQPLSQSALAALESEFLIDWIFGLLHLEQTQLVHAQVADWLSQSPPPQERMATEARRLHAAAKKLLGRARALPEDERDHLTDADLHTFHQTLCGVESDSRMATFRSGEGEAQVETHQPASPQSLPILMAQTLDWFTTDSFAELHPVEKAGLFHLRMLDLQPFSEYTNRLTRLLASFYTLRSGLPPLIFTPEDESAYKDSVGYAFQLITQPSLEVFAFLLLRRFERWNAYAAQMH